MDKMGIAKIWAIIIAVIVIVAAIAAVVIFMMAPMTPTAPTAIKIGYIHQFVGVQATEGQHEYPIIKAFVDEINRGGGIYLKEYGRKIPIQLVVYDGESDVTRNIELVTKAITEDKVCFVHSGGAPDQNIPHHTVCEKYGIPNISEYPIEIFTGEGSKRPEYWKYSWCGSFFSIPDMMKGYFEVFDYFVKKGLVSKKVGYLLEDNPDGHWWYENTKDVYKERGYEVIFPGFFPTGTKDFSGIISVLKEKGVEILHINTYNVDFSTFWRQAISIGYKPKVAIGGRFMGSLDDAIAIGPGDTPLGIMTELWSWPIPGYPGTDWIWETYPKVTTLNMGFGVACQFSTWQFLIKVLEDAGSVDPEKINESIARVTAMTCIGKVDYDPKTHTSPGPALIGQVQKTPEGKLTIAIVWSSDPAVPTVEPILIPPP
ncbi:MAG: ABC transporter substrate-binding protein [Candidatus Bathyarchaeia archaeon]